MEHVSDPVIPYLDVVLEDRTHGAAPSGEHRLSHNIGTVNSSASCAGRAQTWLRGAGETSSKSTRFLSRPCTFLVQLVETFEELSEQGSVAFAQHASKLLRRQTLRGWTFPRSEGLPGVKAVEAQLLRRFTLP